MNKKTIILIIIGYLVTIIATATITYFITKNNYKEQINEINIEKNEEKNNKAEANQEKDVAEPKSVDQKAEHPNNVVTDESKKDTSANIIEKGNESPNIEEPIEVEKTETTEEDVISYIENISLEDATSKLKSGFITVVDFLFYEGEIYGYTFQELSSSAKIKVIALALKIDSKIDEYFPNYKEKITSSTSKAYTTIKSKLVTLYLDTTVKICNDNQTLCEDAKAGLSELKQSFGITWDFIKDISGIGLTKLKEWYEVWREE